MLCAVGLIGQLILSVSVRFEILTEVNVRITTRLDCDAVYCGRRVPQCVRNVVPPSEGSNKSVCSV
jgi:hypothetical protein